MIGPDRYNMASDTPHLSIADDPARSYSTGPRGRFVNGVPEADRLEAALDNALLAKAGRNRRHRHCNRAACPGDCVRMRVGMQAIYPWMGHVTKRHVSDLFRGAVAGRYADAGWADMEVSWMCPQSRAMTFRFGIAEPVGRLFFDGVAFEMSYGFLKMSGAFGTAQIWQGDLKRMLSWLVRRDGRLSSGEIDGVGRKELRGGLHALVCALDAESMMSGSGWLRATLDDLRVSAKLGRFDIDMTKRDGLGPGRRSGFR